MPRVENPARVQHTQAVVMQFSLGDFEKGKKKKPVFNPGADLFFYVKFYPEGFKHPSL